MWKSTRYLSSAKFQAKLIRSRRLYRGYSTRVSRFCSSSSVRFFLSLSFFQFFFFHFSFREAVREPIFPRNVRISARGRNREGNSIGALFYKYLSSFESIGDGSSPPLLFLLPRSFLLVSCSRPLPIFEAKLSGVYLFLQIFYTFRTRICIHNGHERPEPGSFISALFLLPFFPAFSLFIPFSVPLFSLFAITLPKFSSLLRLFLELAFFVTKLKLMYSHFFRHSYLM